MNDEFDPFDINNLRLSPEVAAELARARDEREASKRSGSKPPWLEAKLAAHKAKVGNKKGKRNDLFVQILHTAIAAGGRALRDRQWIVWLYIIYRVQWEKSYAVEVGNVTLKEWGVVRTVKNRALYALERAGLISIEWRRRNSPRVTLLQRDLSRLEREAG